MKRTHARFTRPLVGIAAGLILALAPAAKAEDGHDGHHAKRCSNATLKGTYGFYRTGTTPAGSLAAIGILTFDGKGNAEAKQDISRDGELDLDVEFPSSYEVAEDCTGTGFNEDGIVFTRFVVTEGGKGFYLLSLSPGNTVYGVGVEITGR